MQVPCGSTGPVAVGRGIPLAEGKGLSVRVGPKEAGAQTCELTNRNCIEGLRERVSRHMTTKPTRNGRQGQVNWWGRRLCTESSCSYSGRAVREALRKSVVKSRKGYRVIKSPGVAATYGSRHTSESSRATTEVRRARRAAMRGVSEQQSAEAVVAGATR